MLILTLPACSSRVARPSPPAKVPLPSQEVIAGLLQNGKQAVAQGQYDRAIGLFRRLQDGYPNAPERPEATLLLAQVFEKRGETLQALVEYRKLASDFPWLRRRRWPAQKFPNSNGNCLSCGRRRSPGPSGCTWGLTPSPASMTANLAV